MYRLIRYNSPLATCADRSAWSGFDREFNSLFASALADQASDATRSIPVSVHEDKDNLQVSAELPGVERADINIELLDDTLSLTATRKHGEQVTSFARRFSLPYAAQADKVTASYENGILRLTLPKAEAAKPRQIAIN
ncbi:MAG TPA: Hsp20/alpha crystallin family protein [Lacunisphaera sp.]|jgi:HSP20 family protein|nr:Hsp20/alpha crystallin family protein [Lacunisphaera sp.]HQY06422.1 Hsp20/alpha crystallin family protein [Lacunisphaera sp.]